MADRQVGRTLRRTNAVENTVHIEGGNAGSDASINTGISGAADTVIDEPTQHNVNQPSEPVGDRVSFGVVTVDPERINDYINDTTGDRDSSNRGAGTRKRRSYTRRNGKAKETLPNIEAVVTMVHTWASVLLKTPELMLDESEVKQLSESYATFCEYHTVPMITPKRMSEVNMIATLLALYGTRTVAIMKRRSSERNAHKIHAMPGNHPVAVSAAN